MILTTTEESRALDRTAMEEYGLPEAVLMENAGRAVVELAGERLRWDGAAAVEPLLAPRWRTQFRVAVAGQARLDFTLADKGTGIRQLCAALDVPQSDVMAFGDNYNDLPMLEAVGHPILMEGALAELLSRFSNRCSRAEHILASLPF